MIRLILLLAVVAIGADAILNNGAYTQRAWHELSSRVVTIDGAGPGARVEIVKRNQE